MTDDTRTEVATKHERLVAILDERALDALLLTTAGSVSWLLAGARTTVDAASGPVFQALVTRTGIHLGISANEVNRILAEEVPESLAHDGFVTVHPVPWHEPVGEFVTSVPGADQWAIGEEADHAAALRGARAVLLDADLDRYRPLAQDLASAMSDVLFDASPEMSELDLTAGLAGRARAGGVEPLVLLACGESRAPFRHPLPTETPLGRRAMLVISGRRRGLLAHLTRWVRFGDPKDGEAEFEARLLEVEADIFADLRDGRPLRDMMTTIQRSYPRRFDAEEWTRHHQGGAAGYVGRDPMLTPDVTDVIRTGQAFAWNPSAYSPELGIGAKVEDTVVFHGAGPEPIEVLTVDERWPTTTVNGIARPSTLQL
ncbi:metallopeptidase family M24 [Brevibacterium sanguinis]|uniref:Metallopeptidase family M24 n=2 Tax=Brevibacterium TaxID=1696 RepID=A0A366IGE4_9MICO|nr:MULTISPECIES: M24 family metallopeptidase [Brevibacterium]RBP61976.1 metallopeptidase family M24 [Brevibacterium sanguinis]RBP70602.1 metallopeptidase family M24 [Brevibacterium celere]